MLGYEKTQKIRIVVYWTFFISPSMLKCPFCKNELQLRQFLDLK